MPRSLLVLATFVAACHVDVQAISTTPSPTKLDYPAGIAIDPGARFIYVSNGNADLAYGGGTLMMIDLDRFECAVDAQRVVTAKGSFTDADLDPSCAVFGQALLAADIAVNRNDNNLPLTGCVTDPLDPGIVDCVEDPFVLSNATVKIGNFAGTIRVKDTSPTPGSQTRQVFVAVRGDPSVTYANVDLGKVLPRVDAHQHFDNPGLLDCFDDATNLLARDGYDPSTNTTSVPARCDDSFFIQNFTCQDRFGCTQGDNNIPSEPFDMLLEDGNHADGSAYSRLVVSHLAAGQVSLIDLLGTPRIADVSPPFFAANSQNQYGVFGLARRGDGDSALYYLTSDLSAAISTFSIAENSTAASSSRLRCTRRAERSRTAPMVARSSSHRTTRARS